MKRNNSIRAVAARGAAALLLLAGLAACESGSTTVSPSAPPGPANSVTVQGGAAVLASAMSGLPPNSQYNLTLVALPPTGQQITAIQTDVMVPSGYTRTGSAAVGAFLTMAFEPPAYRGTHDHMLYAIIGFLDGGGTPSVAYDLKECTNSGGCVSIPVSVATVTGWAPNSFVPMSLDSTCTWSIAVDPSTAVFSVSVGGAGCGGPWGATINAASWTSPPFPVDVSAGNVLGSVIQVQLHGGSSGGDGDFSAAFDNVMAGFNGGSANPFDDFTKPQLDMTKWAFAH